MLHASFNPYRLTIRESVGITHETQVVEVPIPQNFSGLFCVQDESTGRLYSIQASQTKPGIGYLLLAVEPYQALSLIVAEITSTSEPTSPVFAIEGENTWTLGNGRFEIELSSGNQRFGQPRQELVLGPVRRMRENQGPWRGQTFFDTANMPVREHAEWLEKGPLRSIYHYRIEFEAGGFYDVEVTVDAALDFARFRETFKGAAADQIVWDFVGPDLPERLSLLDSTAGHTKRWIHYHMDQRHARLWCWNQFSQLHDLSDGFAMHFTGSDDVVALVSLEGGKWYGNALNHLEAWTRRWQSADPTTRRLPADTKADSFPGIDSIPARGKSLNEPHFTLEGWLRQGERRFALVFSTGARIAPKEEGDGMTAGEGNSISLGHFEHIPRRDLYSLVQGRLRKINIQHGQFPLQDQLSLAFEWSLEDSFKAGSAPLSEAQQLALDVAHVHHKRSSENDPDGIKLIDDFLAARVYGFWEGSGSAYTNCVVSRGVGPNMLHFESIVKEGKLSPEQTTRWRAWFSFLAHLYHTDNFYIGASTMEGTDSPNSVEPTIAGMANQNFYTDIIALPAFAAQAFPGHPAAAAWRDKFLTNWHRQLEYHMFPKSGIWEESHTYYQHVIATVLPLFLRRKADGTRDDFADANFQKLVAGAIPQMTPPNAVVDGLRHIVPFGDHDANPKNYRFVYRETARAFAPHAPELAGNLAWVLGEMKGGEVPGVPAQAPKLASGYLEGLGYFFRGNDGAGSESLLALRSGMAWGHHHNDDGSIQFYARGRALIVDAASSNPQVRGERKVISAGHSRVAVDGVEPMSIFWRFNRGWILDSRVGPDLSYAVAGTPTFATRPANLPAQPLQRAYWELRAVVELAPAVYLIADYLDASQRHTVRFHVAHQETTLEGNRLLASFGSDCSLEIAPLFEVKPPELSLDSPLHPAKIPQEITTSVEYGGVHGPWSLFVVAALDPNERLNVSTGPEESRLVLGDKTLTIHSSPDGHLTVSSDGTRVEINAQAFLSQLRIASR
jgi:hypothetical protein